MNRTQVLALRAQASQASCYPFTLRFTREFTSGTLQGLTHADQVGFCTRADCDEWVSVVNQKNAAGKVDYRVISWSVIEGGK